MSRRWAVCLDKTEIESVKKLRNAAGAEVLEREDDIWIRGMALDDHLALVLRMHPHARRHWIMPDDQLLHPGERVPRGRLPEGTWIPLRDWMSISLISLPVAAFAATRPPPVSLRFVRADCERVANVLVTEVSAWHRYGNEAPEVRLARWSFAAAADGRVVVRGLPLPSLPGNRMVEENGVAVPAGWTWLPAVGSEILRTLCGIQDQDMAIWNTDTSWEWIRGELFVRASRSAIRSTAREFAHE